MSTPYTSIHARNTDATYWQNRSARYWQEAQIRPEEWAYWMNQARVAHDLYRAAMEDEVDGYRT